MSNEERRAPVQGGSRSEWRHVPEDVLPQLYRGTDIPPGTISWADHLRVYDAYARRFGTSQSAERLAERGGFGVGEIVWLGVPDALKSWRPQ